MLQDIGVNATHPQHIYDYATGIADRLELKKVNETNIAVVVLIVVELIGFE